MSPPLGATNGNVLTKSPAHSPELVQNLSPHFSITEAYLRAIPRSQAAFSLKLYIFQISHHRSDFKTDILESQTN